MRCWINDTYTFFFVAKFLVLYYLIIGKYNCGSTWYIINLHCALSSVHKLLPYHKFINSSNQKVVVIICYICYKSLYFSSFLFHLVHTQLSGKETKRRFIWRKRDPSEFNKVVLKFIFEFRNQDNAELDPMGHYKRFMNNELLDKIADESNKYAIQSNPSSLLNITRNELEQFFGILYVMSLVNMPSTRLYWSSEFNYDKVASVMTINQFEKIKKFLHCQHNLSRPKNISDRLYKIRPVVDHMKKSFSNIALSEKLRIDEQMVPFKGNSGLKQYNPQNLKNGVTSCIYYQELMN